MRNHPPRPTSVPASRRLVAALSLAAACLLAASCASGGPLDRLRGVGQEPAAKTITEAELAGRLHRIEETFSRSAQSATDSLANESAPPELYRRALAWRLHAIQAIRTAVLAADPQAAFLDVWVFLVQQRTYFRGAAADSHYPGAAERILKGVTECEREVVELGSEFLTKEQLESARKEVESFAAAHAMTDAYARSGNLPALPPTAESSRLEWLTSLPMAPFQVFSGIDEGAAAIRDFTSMAERFSRRVERVPQETAWELQLMLHDTENGPEVQRTISGLEEFSAASASIAATADRLPEDVRTAMDETFAAIDERHPKVDATIASVRDVVAKTEKPLADAAATAKSLDEAGDAWKGAVESFHALTKDLSPSEDATKPTAPEESARPFDIREYGATAVEIAGTARELRGTVDSLRGLLKDANSEETAKRVAQMTQESAQAARHEGEALVDHVFVRALQFAAVLAVLAVGGVLAVRRWGRKG